MGPRSDIVLEPELAAALTKIDNRRGHVRVAMLIGTYAVRVRKAKPRGSQQRVRPYLVGRFPQTVLELAQSFGLSQCASPRSVSLPGTRIPAAKPSRVVSCRSRKALSSALARSMSISTLDMTSTIFVCVSRSGR